jgi:hypothetical protein
MRLRVLLSRLLLATILAAAAAYFAVASLNVSGIYPTSWTDAAIIRHRCPVRLVDPERLGRPGDVLMNWVAAEVKARLGLIAVLWLVGMGFITARARKKRPDMG